MLGCSNPFLGALKSSAAATTPATATPAAPEPSPEPAAADYPYGTLTASRSSGVAPLYVAFSADFDSSGDAAKGFQAYEYSWNFGDSASGEWGTSGNCKNSAKGGVAGHVYETQGTYTATVTIRSSKGVVGSKSFTVSVMDPDAYYAGTKTTCVSDASSADFSGAPAGARLIATDDLSSITKYATAGSRLLLRRGSSWTTGNLSWPENAGPVTIGAYGSGSGADSLGIYSNAPQITVTSGTFLSMNFKQDWRIMDLHLVDLSRANTSISGVMEMQQILSMRLKIEGFETAFGWSHWNTSKLMPIDQMAVVSCDFSNAQSNIGFVGGERLAVLGNIMKDPQDSHVLRVWQAYRSVISENILSGSSVNSTAGRHALKLHGPGYSTLYGVNEYGTPAADTGLLAHRTEFVVVSDNIIGSSGPWPVIIGPQDELTDSALSNIVFERNRIVSEYGTQSRSVDVALHLWASYSTLRNNIFDGSGSGTDYTAIAIYKSGAEPAPSNDEVYNNTIYRADNGSGNQRIGIQVGSTAVAAVVKNNLAYFPGAAVPTSVLSDSSGTVETGGNLLASAACFANPDAASPLSRDFSLLPGSAALDQGVDVPVLEDFSGKARVSGAYDIGACER